MDNGDDLMDPEELPDFPVDEQSDESSFGLYDVESAGEGPCGGCQGT